MPRSAHRLVLQYQVFVRCNMFRLPLAQRIVAAARRVSERAASSASVSLTFQTRPQPAWLAARRLSALKFTNVRFARSFAAAADASPNAKQEPAADKPSEEEQRMRDGALGVLFRLTPPIRSISSLVGM
jgi:hypothetical protein